MPTITVPFNYNPRSYQLPFLRAMDNGYKRAVCVWHRRSGKDKTYINFVAKKAMERVGAYYYFFPTYSQGKKILWNGMDRDGFKFLSHIPDSIRKKPPNDTDMRVELKNGSIIQVIGTDNIDSIMGTNPVGCVFSEFSLQRPAAWDMVRPILRENGGWAAFNMTPRGRNHGYELAEMARNNPDSWFYQLLTVNDTSREDGSPIISLSDIEQERREGMAEELVQQEYYCSFVGAILGAYYGQLMGDVERSGRIRNVPYDPILPVTTAWDLGMDDSMTIWFIQIVPGGELRVIDYYEKNGKGFDHYAGVLREKGYHYSEHLMPHDIEVRELGSGKTRKESAENLGIRPIRTSAKLSVNEGINAVRNILPRMYFDTDKTKDGRDCLANYKHEYDEDKKIFADRPEHDWASHGADSMRTFAVSFQEVQTQQSRQIRSKMSIY
jgi:phage terminase large subunit